MDTDDKQLAEQLKDSLIADGRPTAFQEPSPDEDPLQTDFFKALNAFRAARSRGDREEMALAEEHLRRVVRSEITGEPCE